MNYDSISRFTGLGKTTAFKTLQTIYLTKNFNPF